MLPSFPGLPYALQAKVYSSKKKQKVDALKPIGPENTLRTQEKFWMDPG
jgi:hypothetical protein